ncbi:hypothetical protein [Ruegeria arenilitoris]|uniref:hypothetical protein n=1 Tax=Ruegeria arenilitoris TaxID=1173585 RepID=UPI0014798F6A|nr:hypothetical protein [Ruegeria arenilitoris]
MTSAALVALLVAVVVFPWQRSLEHKYQIKKEKRELFRKLIAKFSEVGQAVTLQDYKSATRSLAEFEGLSYEVELLTSMGVSNALREISGHCKRQIKPLPQLYEDFCYQHKKEPEKAGATLKKLEEASFKIGSASGYLSTLLKEDIVQTAVDFDWRKKKRVPRLVGAIKEKFGETSGS